MIGPKYERWSRHNKTTRPPVKDRKAAYEIVAIRSGGKCEHCLVTRAEAKHHRLYRSRGGEDEATNLLDLCRVCHELAHKKAGELIGLSVPSGMIPAQVSVRDVYGRTWIFLADGTKEATV